MTFSLGEKEIDEVGLVDPRYYIFRDPVNFACGSLEGCTYDTMPGSKDSCPWFPPLREVAVPLFGWGTEIWYYSPELSLEEAAYLEEGSVVILRRVFVRFTAALVAEVPEWIALDLLGDFKISYETSFEPGVFYTITGDHYCHKLMVTTIGKIHDWACRFYHPVKRDKQ